MEPSITRSADAARRTVRTCTRRLDAEPQRHRWPALVYRRRMGNVLRVAAAVILKEDHVLACRRRAGKAAGGKWEFPGGKIETGETPEEAVRREISEELGSKIRVLGELTTNDTLVGETTIRLICLRAELLGEPPRTSTDHDRMVWIAVQDLSALDWAAPDLPAVEVLMAARP